MPTPSVFNVAPGATIASDQDARVLAGLLRSTPLTVLLSPPGIDTTPMLRHGVMPMLHRRASDRAPADTTASANVIGFTDRRDARAGLLARRDREIAVFFDTWSGDPTADLLRQVRQAIDSPWMSPVADDRSLADALADLQSRHNLRFLLLLDRFDEALAGRVEAPRLGEFIEQWLEAIASPTLAAHFLVALPEAALGRFDGVRERIADFDDRVLRANGAGRLFGLASVMSSVPADVMAAVAAAPREPSTVASALAPMPDADPDADSLSTSTPNDPAPDAFPDIGRPVAEAAPAESLSPNPASSHVPAASLPPTSTSRSPDPSAWPEAYVEPAPAAGAPTAGLRAPSLAWLALPVLAAAAWWWFDRDAALVQPGEVPRPSTAARPQAAPRPSAQTPPIAATPPADSLLGAAALDIAIDPANGTDVRVARELTASLTPAGGIELPALPSRGGLATLIDLAAASTSPRLAIANYDALQAARALSPRPQLAVVTPLYRQEIYFIVRADSPLRFLHDLRGARIEAGPSDGSRSLTAAAVYRQLFDQPMPTGAPSARNEDDGLAEMLAFRTVDVVMTVGGQPLPWLANLPKATRDRIRLLRVDAIDPVDRRALRTFLPATVQGPALGGAATTTTPSLSVMSFLVTNARPDDATASARLTDFTRGLCQALPALRRAGHPKWSEVRPGLMLPAGFPDSVAAQAGFQDCRVVGDAAPTAEPSLSTASTRSESHTSQHPQLARRPE